MSEQKPIGGVAPIVYPPEERRGIMVDAVRRPTVVRADKVDGGWVIGIGSGDVVRITDADADKLARTLLFEGDKEGKDFGAA